MDAGAVEEAGAGAAAAFETLLRPMIEPGYRLACGILQDPVAAEDAVQEACLKAWRKLGNLRAGADPLPWFLGIVANQCRDTVRHRWWSVLKLQRVEPAAPGAIDDAVAGSHDLRLALRSLDATSRAVVVLHYYLDLPLEQVAAAIGSSVPATRGRLYRALKRLRGSIGDG